MVKNKTAELDNPLHAIGFKIDVVSPVLVSGRLKITQVCCQPFGVLHGGISALISEGLASIGAHIAGGFRRIAGIQLTINHMKTAKIGDTIIAEATPVKSGRTIQVWHVRLWKVDDKDEKGQMVASSTLTLLCNLSQPDQAAASITLKKYAKL
ncbi:Thioesterase superfamily protein [Zostera marina]|uniref:Thioesterase superfamily protein n=1 Tax=Zostera marina TaxID=29655 RepID=A0A0K9NTH7_ZOSMR|nr:Thioesterase superfamily protein [Zostera marina]